MRSFPRIIVLPQLVGLLLLFGVLAGCGSILRQASEEVPRAATPAVVDSGLEQLEDPKVRARIAAIMQTPEIKAALDAAAAEIANGAVGGLTRDDAQARLDRLATALVASTARALAQSVRTELVPATREVVRGLSDADKKAITDAVSAGTQAITKDVAQTLGTELPPALGKTIATSLEKPEVRAQFEDVVRQVAKSSALGAAEAASEIQARNRRGFWAVVVGSAAFAVAVPALVGALVAGAIAYIFVLRGRNRRLELERAREEAAAARVAASLANVRGRPWAADFYADLEASLGEGEAADARALLARAGALPLRPRSSKTARDDDRLSVH
jgi:hypothetical protein